MPIESQPDILAELARVEHLYRLPSGKTVQALSDINLTLRGGELVALLGPSGCGKSTLIRIATGLLQPTHGSVSYRGKPLSGPNPRMALVFQQFALYPWLTVAQNIEQALIPLGIARDARKQRASEAIALIGLEGFEEAYPRELSSSMKQRVGMARALSVQPEVLCMDEPFSQVDVLTAETLRNEVINLWRDRERYPSAILLVSHDIHEVALMASRILVFAANPGRIKTVIENTLPYPRDARSTAYQALVDRLHRIITGLYLPEEESAKAVTILAGMAGVQEIAPVPLVEVRVMVGLLEVVHSRGGDVEIFRLTAEMGTAFTRILLASKAAELLGFMATPQDRLVVTDLGRQLIAASRKARRQIFREQVIRLALFKRIKEMLEHSEEHRLEKELLLEELAIQCPQEDPKRLFRVLINWGRFADLWAYQPATSTLSTNGGTPKPPVSGQQPPAAPEESASPENPSQESN